jgi:hypothetical protein
MIMNLESHLSMSSLFVTHSSVKGIDSRYLLSLHAYIFSLVSFDAFASHFSKERGEGFGSPIPKTS